MLKNKFRKRIVAPVMAAAMLTIFGVSGAHYSEAATISTSFSKWERSAKTAVTHAGRKKRSSRAGVVSITGTDGFSFISAHGTSYTVDTIGANIMKSSSTTAPYIISIADIHVGDRVIVRGKIEGTAILAKSILV